METKPLRALTTPKLHLTTPLQTVIEVVAAEQKKVDDELAHRLAMNVLGIAEDPLKAAIEKVIPGRVDAHGKLTKDSRSI